MRCHGVRNRALLLRSLVFAASLFSQSLNLLFLQGSTFDTEKRKETANDAPKTGLGAVRRLNPGVAACQPDALAGMESHLPRHCRRIMNKNCS